MTRNAWHIVLGCFFGNVLPTKLQFHMVQSKFINAYYCCFHHPSAGGQESALEAITKDRPASFTQARVCHRSAMSCYFRTTCHIRNIFQNSAMETVSCGDRETDSPRGRLTHKPRLEVT